LNTWQGTLAEVIVNQKSAGIIAWEPHELNITPWIKNGYNEITVKIYGSLTNLFGPRHEYTAGISPPHSVYNIPDKQPLGNQYHSNDYGLYKPFEIIEVR
jgi:hypothetical protein